VLLSCFDVEQKREQKSGKKGDRQPFAKSHGVYGNKKVACPLLFFI